MAELAVVFTFHTGLRHHLFRNVRLSGSWNSWADVAMEAAPDETGCDAFTATVSLDEAAVGETLQWGVRADFDGTPNTWVVATEVAEAESSARYRTFVLSADSAQRQDYWFVHGRYFGARKCLAPGADSPGIRFAAWAPNAKAVEVVFAPCEWKTSTPTGYIADDGTGVDPTAPPVPLVAKGGGVWESAALAGFSDYLNRLYMFRITNEQGQVTYKVDLYSRNQAGRGVVNPQGKVYTGSYADLDGIVSCSIVSDPDQVTASFTDKAVAKETLIPVDEFWANEYTAGHLPPQNIEDLVIYELHVGSLGFPSTLPGTFADAIEFVDRLVDLGVNAVELLPVEEFDGKLQWGYGTSLFFCMQSSAGGANQLKHFVRKCHQQGIAVIVDVCYNHYATANNERAEWGYDSDPAVAPQNNVWNWYEGQPSDYPDGINGGYLNNGSSGFTPRFSEEHVRKMFTSSTAALFDDFHIDGLRVDLTDAIHQNNTLNVAGGPVVARANQYGVKLLRELAYTVRIVNPSAFLIAEDHTGWSAMTQPLDQGGIGFDAVWYADFYHHLIGDGNYGEGYAKLLKIAGAEGSGGLRMDFFGDALLATQYSKVVYHESHDEAGNESGTQRTMVTAGATRAVAEGRSRFAFGMAALSAGTAMFLMGEEIGATKAFHYNDFFLNKEDLIGQRGGDGRFLFRFYQDLIGFVSSKPAARSRNIDVIYTHNDNRIIAFTRTAADQQLLVIGSLNDAAFDHGYVLSTDASRLPAGGWREVFNSDAAIFGGAGVGNAGAVLPVSDGHINAVLPARGFVVFEKIA